MRTITAAVLGLLSIGVVVATAVSLIVVPAGFVCLADGERALRKLDALFPALAAKEGEAR